MRQRKVAFILLLILLLASMMLAACGECGTDPGYDYQHPECQTTAKPTKEPTPTPPYECRTLRDGSVICKER